VADLDVLAPGDHICWAVDADDDFELTAKRCLVEGSRVGDKVLYVGPAASLPGSPLSAVAVKAFDPGPALTGPAGVDDMLQVFRLEATSATDDGFRALRVVADMDWMAGLATNDELTAFELRLDAVADEVGAVVICAYRATTFPAGEVARVNTVHSQTFGQPDDLGFRVCSDGPQCWDVTGEVDCFNAEAFGLVLASAASSGTVRVRLDRLEFIDVAGMRAIAAAAEAGAVARMSLESPSETFARCWALLGYEALAPKVELVR